MSAYVAVNNGDFELKVIPVAGPSANIATPNNGTATPVLPGLFGIGDCKYIEDDKCKASGDKILVDEITQKGIAPLGAKDDFSCAPTSTAPFTFSSPGVYNISSGSLKNKCSGIAPMLEDDTTIVNCVCAGNDSTTPTPVAFAGSCVVKISKAGQDRVLME